MYLQRSESNQSSVLLTDVANTIAGKYSCEVSADAPTFNTAIDAGEMEVVGKCIYFTRCFKRDLLIKLSTEIPEQRPIITGIHSRYKFGDIINGNCSSDNSYPAANLSWFINDIPVSIFFFLYEAVLLISKSFSIYVFR